MFRVRPAWIVRLGWPLLWSWSLPEVDTPDADHPCGLEIFASSTPESPQPDRPRCRADAEDPANAWHQCQGRIMQERGFGVAQSSGASKALGESGEMRTHRGTADARAKRQWRSQLSHCETETAANTLALVRHCCITTRRTFGVPSFLTVSRTEAACTTSVSTAACTTLVYRSML